MRRIEFVTVEAFSAFIAHATREGLAFTAHESHSGQFVVTVTGY